VAGIFQKKLMNSKKVDLASPHGPIQQPKGLTHWAGWLDRHGQQARSPVAGKLAKLLR
jgi:hypothetical protein